MATINKEVDVKQLTKSVDKLSASVTELKNAVTALKSSSENNK